MLNFFGSNPLQNSRITREEQLHSDLIKIIQDESIEIVFQPIINLLNGEVTGYEALSRGPKGTDLEKPEMLFATARKYNLLFEIEFLCRRKALEKACQFGIKELLFLNVDPNVVKDPRFKSGFTKEMLEINNLKPSQLIFEITEKTIVEDFVTFTNTLDNYARQGYKIAIDDMGSGYSNLRMIAETHPHFIKIDLELVRNIDKDPLRKSLLKCISDFSMDTSIKLIAEGIETVDELNTLMDIGITLGQGFYLHKPSQVPAKLTADMKNLICRQQAIKGKHAMMSSLNIPVWEIMRFDICITESMPNYKVNEVFQNNANLQGITVVDGAVPVGLIMRNKFYQRFASQYGAAIYMKRPVSLVMDRHPLIVDCNASINSVSRLALTRREDNLYDYVIVTKNDNYAGIVTINRLLEKITEIELNIARNANPLTGLPGNLCIEKELEQVLNQQDQCYILYFDLDNFKAYNDVYGFENGDKIIQLTSRTILENMKRFSFKQSFLGHIGGDDFIAIIYGLNVSINTLCQAIIDSFDLKVRHYYKDEDQKRGYILAKNRKGKEEKYPITTISIGVLNYQGNNFKSIIEIGEAASRLKKECKARLGSCYCY
ncbi:GGDEF domain-containing protein [Bacillota bacterium LX-D]|nr:GGDEF domain-containing protein [Bacillota bacterium LX-D]